jgi:hypothetical protein
MKKPGKTFKKILEEASERRLKLIKEISDKLYLVFEAALKYAASHTETVRIKCSNGRMRNAWKINLSIDGINSVKVDEIFKNPEVERDSLEISQLGIEVFKRLSSLFKVNYHMCRIENYSIIVYISL